MATSAIKPKHWLIIPAAGIGSRMGASIPKQYLSIQNTPILELTISTMLDFEVFDACLVGLHPHDTHFQELSKTIRRRVEIYVGGKERFETVALGLEQLTNRASPQDWVWVHDAARPFVSKEELTDLLASLEEAESGALLAIGSTDTIKHIKGDGRIETLDRSKVWRAQTPQVFRFELLRQALAEAQAAPVPMTDEASAIELAGFTPKLVPGKASNIKITYPEDLTMSSDTPARSSHSPVRPSIRIGSGYDVHAFEEGSFITLGGVEIPFEKGLKAHSDGDVLLHALCDALLGALALGDIGHHFPDTDPKWAGADSRQLLQAVCALICERGYRVANVDATIEAQAPKMAPHLKSMRECIAEDLSICLDQVSVKATTTERLGFVGRSEGIACQASVLVVTNDLP